MDFADTRAHARPYALRPGRQLRMVVEDTRCHGSIAIIGVLSFGGARQGEGRRKEGSGEPGVGRGLGAFWPYHMRGFRVGHGAQGAEGMVLTGAASLSRLASHARRSIRAHTRSCFSYAPHCLEPAGWHCMAMVRGLGGGGGGVESPPPG